MYFLTFLFKPGSHTTREERTDILLGKERVKSERALYFHCLFLILGMVGSEAKKMETRGMYIYFFVLFFIRV